MKKRKNVLRNLLKAGKPSLGVHVHVTWPGFVEVIGHTGVIDYIEFSGEYAPYDLYSLENFGRAVDLFPHMTSMIKIDQDPRLILDEPGDRFGYSEPPFRGYPQRGRRPGIGCRRPGGNAKDKRFYGRGDAEGCRLCSRTRVQGIRAAARRRRCRPDDRESRPPSKTWRRSFP